jgi:predicted nucleic acid-binding protein
VKCVVVDASVVLRWYLADEGKGGGWRGLDLLEDYVGGKIRLIAPAILDYEVLNGLVIACRRGRLDEDFAREAYRAFKALGIETGAGAEGEAIIAAAFASGLTAYDAAYLALARTENAELATADWGLAEAAKRLGIARGWGRES